MFGRESTKGKLIIAVNAGNNEYKLKTDRKAEDLYGGSVGYETLIPPLGFVVLKAV